MQQLPWTQWNGWTAILVLIMKGYPLSKLLDRWPKIWRLPGVIWWGMSNKWWKILTFGIGSKFYRKLEVKTYIGSLTFQQTWMQMAKHILQQWASFAHDGLDHFLLGALSDRIDLLDHQSAVLRRRLTAASDNGRSQVDPPWDLGGKTRYQIITYKSPCLFKSRLLPDFPTVWVNDKLEGMFPSEWLYRLQERCNDCWWTAVGANILDVTIPSHGLYSIWKLLSMASVTAILALKRNPFLAR